MKTLLSFALAAGVLIATNVLAEETLRSENKASQEDYVLIQKTCPLEFESRPAYKWDRSRSRWVFVGYVCKKSGSTGH